MLESEDNEHRLIQILDAISRIASLDFENLLEAKNDNSKEDMIIQALNMLSEEWKETVVSKEALLEKQELLIKASVDLKKANTLFEDTGKMTRTGSWELDIEKQLLYWSSMTKEIHEVAPNYAPNLETAINFYKEGKSRSTIERLVNDAINNGAEYDVELELITTKNRRIWVRSTGRPVIENGEVVKLIGSFQDITERKIKDEQIQSFSNMVYNSSNEVYFIDIETLKFVFVNKSACDNLGYTKEELFKLSPLDLKSDFNEKKFTKTIAPLVKHDVEKVTFKTVHTRKDGSVYPVEVYLDIHKFNDRRVFKAMVIDITEREKAEILAKHVSQISSTHGGKEYFNELVCLLNKSLNVKYAFVGEYLPDTNSVKTISFCIDGKLQENFVYSLNHTPCQVIIGSNIESYPSNVQKSFPNDKDLEIMKVESYSGSALLDDNEAPIGLIVVMDTTPMLDIDTKETLLDIVTRRTETELKRLKTENRLRLSEEKYRLLFENANDGILIIDRDTKLIKDANITAASNLGFERNELINLPIISLYEADNLPFIKGVLGELLDKETVTFETKQVRKDKSFLPVEVSAKVIDYGGKKVIQSIIRDVSERYETEKEKEKLFIEIQESEKRFKHLFYRNVAGVFRSNIKTGILLDCNKAFAKIFGFSSIHKIVNSNMESFYFSGEDRIKLIEKIKDNFLVTNYKIKYKDKNGSVVWGLLSASLIDDEYVEGTVVEITEQINFEFQKEQAFDELLLIDSINNIANSKSTFTELTEHVFNLYKIQVEGIGGRVYSYDECSNKLIIDNESLEHGIIQKIEKKTGIKVSNHSPILKLSKHYLGVIKSQKMFVSSNPTIINSCIEEYTSSALLKKFAPWIKGMLKIKTYIIMPVVVQGKTIGVYSLPSKIVLSDLIIQRLKRINNQVNLILSRMYSEDSLIKSEEKYRSLFEKMNEGLMLSDENGIIQFVNPFFCDMTGYSKAELLGKNGYELLLDNEMRDQIRSKVRFRKKGLSEQYETKLIRKDNTEIWTRINASPKVDLDGNLDGIMSIITNITERKVSEMEVAKLSQAVNQIPVLIVITDLQGNIEYVNPYFEEITGYTLQEVLGKNPSFLSSGELKQRDYELLWETISSNKTWEGEFLNVKKDGSVYWEKAKIRSIVDKNNNPTHYIAIKEDITEKKDIERKLKHSLEYTEKEVVKRTLELENTKKELEESLNKEMELGELKSRFVSTASHQFRTPLTVIQTNMSILSMQMDKMNDEFKPKFEQAYTRIKGQISRMTDLMNDVLILGKINAGNIIVKSIQTDLVSICEDIVTNFNEIQIDSRRMVVQVVGKERYLYLDKQLMGYAISNVVSNALKYSDGCATPIFTISFSEEDVKISIKDFGIGIFKNELTHIFDPFYRGSNTKDISGTGLGTSITKEYVELNGGEINMFSVPDEGTEVTLTFIQ